MIFWYNKVIVFEALILNLTFGKNFFMKIAVVGATGMVGKVMLEVLAERKIKFDELILVASERSVGK